MISKAPPIHDISRRSFFAAFFPQNCPILSANSSVMSTMRITSHIGKSDSPIPIPIGRLSAERVTASIAASVAERIFEQSASAVFGSAYTESMNFKLMRENEISFLQFSVFSKAFLIITSKSLKIPIKNSSKKLIMATAFSVRYPVRQTPEHIAMQINVRLSIWMVNIERKGIFMLLVPYEKAAQNASIEIAVANTIISAVCTEYMINTSLCSYHSIRNHVRRCSVYVHINKKFKKYIKNNNLLFTTIKIYDIMHSE